jgi:hypothetical protein
MGQSLYSKVQLFSFARDVGLLRIIHVENGTETANADANLLLLIDFSPVVQIFLLQDFILLPNHGQESVLFSVLCSHWRGNLFLISNGTRMAKFSDQ